MKHKCLQIFDNFYIGMKFQMHVHEWCFFAERILYIQYLFSVFIVGCGVLYHFEKIFQLYRGDQFY